MKALEALKGMSRSRLIGVCAGSIAGCALIGTGVWMAMRPGAPGLPRTAQEAAAVLASGRLDMLDDERRRQYMQEMHRLMQGLSEEERRAIFEDEALRQGLRDARRDRMEEVAKEFARTGEFPGGRRGGPGMGGFGGPGGEAMRERFENMTEEERDAMREQRRQAMIEEMAQQTSSGNAQSNGLQQEMMKRMQERRAQGGGGGGGPRGGG